MLLRRRDLASGRPLEAQMQCRNLIFRSPAWTPAGALVRTWLILVSCIV